MGGNWITTDQFLRFSIDAARYEAEVNLHKEMGKWYALVFILWTNAPVKLKHG